MKPKFSEWTKFSNREKLAGINVPGVYLLAHFERKPSGRANFTSDRIVYIGETTSQTILKRLYQFQRSAFKKKTSHSGGGSYNDKCLLGKAVTEEPNNLCVAILPVNKEYKERKAYIKYVERLAIWEFFVKNKVYPKCNSA